MKAYIFICLILLIDYAESTFCYKNEHCLSGYCVLESRERNVDCQYGVCGCPEGKYLKNFQCHPERQHGEYCAGYNECSRKNYLLCKQNTCECLNELYKVENGKCVPKKPVRYGERCRFNNRIEGLCIDKNTYCSREVCECVQPTVRKDNVCRRLKYREACSSGFVCDIYATCINGKCECALDKVYHKVLKPNGDIWEFCDKKYEIVKKTAKGENYSCGVLRIGRGDIRKIWVTYCPDGMTCGACMDADSSIHSLCRKIRS